ncbi:MAG: hypothetical protein ACYSTT_05970 [Planctomycetota bacterium]|jgi:hypothetical protein
MWGAARIDEELDETIKASDGRLSRDCPYANPKDQSLMPYVVNINVSLTKLVRLS